MITHKTQLRRYMLAGLLAISLAGPGCMTTRVVSQYDSNTIANNPLNRRTTWTYAWGLVQPKDINPKCSPSFNHLNSVSVRTNFGYLLLSVATLGIVVPMQVEWTCAPPDPATETLGR